MSYSTRHCSECDGRGRTEDGRVCLSCKGSGMEKYWIEDLPSEYVEDKAFNYQLSIGFCAAVGLAVGLITGILKGCDNYARHGDTNKYFMQSVKLVPVYVIIFVIIGAAVGFIIEFLTRSKK